MLKIYTTNLEKGMILDEDVIDSAGKILLSKGMILSENIIEKIKKIGIKEVYIMQKSSSIKITGIAETHSGNEENFHSENIEIHQVGDEAIQEVVEGEFETLSSTMKTSILNLNLSEDEIMKNTSGVSNAIKENFNENTTEILNSILTVRTVDEYLYRHSVNVSVISFMIGKWLGYDAIRLDKLVKAALLHDIGKLKVPPHILNKPGKLTEEEFVIMKNHALFTYQILQNFKNLDPEVLNGATFHHEKLDGSGYPLGLKGNQIHEFAKIICIADIFDAMTSNRVYHKKKSPFKVLEMFENHSFGKLDLKITMLFIKRFIEYYIGASILLNNGKTARIIRLNINEITKPLIMTEQGSFLDMSKARNISIEDFATGEACALTKERIR